MVRRRLLYGVAIALVLTFFVPAAPAAIACVLSDRLGGECPQATGTINNGGVDVSAGRDGAGGDGGRTGSGRTGSGTGTGRGADADGLPDDGIGRPAPVVRDEVTVGCIPNSPCDPNAVAAISDLVNFKPSAPTQAMEPNGWTVIGLPTNFVAAGSVHTLSGLLLGYPADVQFTPVGYYWSYGDGGSGASADGGATWADLGLPEFSDTDTSHVYRARGTFTVTMSIRYSAQFRFAGKDWRDVQGSLAVAGNPLTVVAKQARTALVAEDCAGNPRGPGC